MKTSVRKKKIRPWAVPIYIILGAAVLLLVFLGGRILYSYITPIKYDAETVTISDIDSTSWMGGIPDDTGLTDITIPGTHDSATAEIVFPYSYSCQELSISEQLASGFRFFDLRCMVDEDSDGELTAVLHHGNGICRKKNGDGETILTLGMVFGEMCDFLSEHPTECIMVMVKPQGDEEEMELFYDTVGECITENPDMWYTDNRIPDLGEVRGKIVLFIRTGDINPEYGIGMYFSDIIGETEGEVTVTHGSLTSGNDLIYQDESSLGTGKKWEAFSAMLETAANLQYTGTLRLNYLSTSSGFLRLPSPKENARTLNRKLMETELTEKNYGVILVDFGTEELAKKIYLCNFR